MNKVILMGRLTADPEFRQTQSGIFSCKFSIAVNRKFTNKQTGERNTDFIRCTAWRQTAEFINRYFKKGNMICVEGELRQSNYQDKNHPDVMHYTYDVQVDNVEFTGEKLMNGNNGGYGNNGYNNNGYSAPQDNYGSPQGNFDFVPQGNYNNGYPSSQGNYNNSPTPQQFGALNDDSNISNGDFSNAEYEDINSDSALPF